MFQVTLRDLRGNPTKVFEVSKEKICVAPSSKPSISHHVVIVDRSGSMYADIESVRSVVEKVAVLEEYRDSGLLFSVVSYSSSGDCTLHFARQPLSEVMKPGSAMVEQIRSIRSTGLTCMSQAVKMGLDLVRQDEPTVVTLHSDGYCNDPSPRQEQKQIEALLDDAKKNFSSLAFDTVAYSDRSDFRLLLSFSERMGGRCVVARDARTVYDALLETQKRLAEGTTPPLQIQSRSDLVLVVCRSAGKVLLDTSDVTVRGLKAGEEVEVFRLNASAGAGPSPAGEELEVLYGLSMAWLAKGQIRLAKEALCGTRDQIYQTHWRALSRTDLQAFFEEVSVPVLSGEVVHRPRTVGFGVLAQGASVLELFSVMAEHKRDLKVDLASMREGYRLKSVRKLDGSRDEEGQIVPPPVQFTAIDEGQWVKVSGIQLSNENATLNLRTVRRGKLVPRDGAKLEHATLGPDGSISSVAGVDLSDLKVFRNFTVVSDGCVHLPQICLQVSSKAAWTALSRLGVAQGSFQIGAEINVNLSAMPVVDLEKKTDSAGLDGVVRQLLIGKMLGSVLRAMSVGTSARFSDEQVQALAAACVTPNLYVSIPSTVPYTDLSQALKDGIVDVEVGTSVQIGLHELLPSQLPSANEFLARHFSVFQDGAEVKGPKFANLFGCGVIVDSKELSSRAKPTVADAMFKPIFLDLFGEGKEVLPILAHLGVSRELSEDLLRCLPKLPSHGNFSQISDAERRIQIVAEVQEIVSDAMESLLGTQIRPLVFWVGATGSLPDGVDVPALDADQAKAKCPQLKIGKDLSDASFYFLPGGVLLAAVPEQRYYSLR